MGNMARMHSFGKGVSTSMRPFTTTVPTFIPKPLEEIEAEIIHLSKRGNGASVIGKILRDNYGIGIVKDVLGMNLMQFLKKHNATPLIPEDLNALVEKAQ